MTQFGANRFRHQHGLKELRKEFDRTDEYQVIERPGVGDDDPNTASAESIEGLPLTLKICEAIGLEDLMRLQEPIKLYATQTEQQT